MALPRAESVRDRLDCRTGEADENGVGLRGGVDGIGCDAWGRLEIEEGFNEG